MRKIYHLELGTREKKVPTVVYHLFHFNGLYFSFAYFYQKKTARSMLEQSFKVTFSIFMYEYNTYVDARRSSDGLKRHFLEMPQLTILFFAKHKYT